MMEQKKLIQLSKPMNPLKRFAKWSGSDGGTRKTKGS